MAFACGGGDGSELEPAAATLTAADNACTVTGAASAYGAGDSGGATAIGQDTMTITCTLPLQDNAETVACTMGILDQRGGPSRKNTNSPIRTMDDTALAPRCPLCTDWGGCIDVNLASAAAALPPSPPPAPFVSSAG